MFEMHLTLLVLLLRLRQTEGIEMAALEHVAEHLLRSNFVDLGTGRLGLSRYLLYFLMWYPSVIKMRVKHNSKFKILIRVN